MVKIHTVYEGELRCQATHGPSSLQLTTDAPVDNLGKGASFSPTDLVATAVGTCMVTTMGIVAERHGWSLVGATADVVKHMVADPKRRIGKVDIVIRVPAIDGGRDDKQRAALERAAMTCPVHASLHPSVEIPVRFEWEA